MAVGETYVLSRVGSCAIVPRERGGEGGSYRVVDPLFSFYYTEGMIPCSGAANQLGGGIVNLSVGKGAPHGSSDMSPGPGWAVPVGFRERYLMSNLG